MNAETIHTCSYYCERPECVRRQRDELRDRMEAALAQQPASVGEEIMVNAAHGVFTLPLQPSGLSSGPRFVVHVPGPDQQPAAVDEAMVDRAGQAFVWNRLGIVRGVGGRSAETQGASRPDRRPRPAARSRG